MRKTLGWALRFAWLTVCVTALVTALHGYQGKSDWREEEGLAFAMIVLGFPASLLIVFALTFTGFALGRFGISLPPPSKPAMATSWLFLFAAGFVQWFFVIPRIFRSRRNPRNKEINSN